MSTESGSEGNQHSFDFTHHETLEELRGLPDSEVELRHDTLVHSLVDGSMDPQERQLRIERAHAYREVLSHRQSARQAERMEALTRSMNCLTWVVVLATIAGVGTSVWVTLSGG